MEKTVSSIDDILKVMPEIQETVRTEIRARMAKGEEICHVAGGKVMINDRIVGAVRSVR